MFAVANLYYLGTKISTSTQRIIVHKQQKDEELAVTVDKDQEIVDVYSGIKFNWILQSSIVRSFAQSGKNSNPKIEIRFFELSFPKKHRDFALKVYLPYVLKKSKEIEEQNRTVRLHTVDYNGTDYWSSVVLNHPATFDTMAMEPDVKQELIGDLERFRRRKDYYRRVG